MLTFTFQAAKHFGATRTFTTLALMVWTLALQTYPAQAQEQDGLKKSIVPGQWQTGEDVPAELATRFGKVLGEELAGSFVVVEGAAAAAKAEEKKEETGDIFDQIGKEAKDEAKAEAKGPELKVPPGTQLTFLGTLSRGAAPNAVTAQVKLLQARTKETLDSFEVKIPGTAPDTVSDEALRAAAQQVVKQAATAAAKVPWEAQVSQVQAADNGVVIRVFVRAGTRHGLKENARFAVYRPGQPVTDPETGEVLEPAKDRRMGAIAIRKVTATSATADPTQGDGFQIGDVIRVLPPLRR